MGFLDKLKDKKWLQALGKVAPKIATALGGPFAGMALGAVGEALGLDSKPTEADIKRLVAEGNPETFLALRKAEQAFEIRMRELDIEEKDLAYKDTGGAREMHIALQDKTPTVLATVIFTIFGGITGAILWGMISQNLAIDPVTEKFLYFLFGLVGSWVGQVVSFYFGSSKGSLVKTIQQAEAMQGYLKNGKDD
jgi:hypothetical protein